MDERWNILRKAKAMCSDEFKDEERISVTTIVERAQGELEDAV